MIMLYVILGRTVIITVVLVCGSGRWRSAKKEMHARLEEACLPVKTIKYEAKKLNGLPAPVQRYFRKDGSHAGVVVLQI
ncbi:MAG: hypothetical protein JXB24_13115 [Bacteroidales bacterium]|nr:hypothetical protein [Bacteroidales bacterium]